MTVADIDKIDTNIKVSQVNINVQVTSGEVEFTLIDQNNGQKYIAFDDGNRAKPGHPYVFSIPVDVGHELVFDMPYIVDLSRVEISISVNGTERFHGITFDPAKSIDPDSIDARNIGQWYKHDFTSSQQNDDRGIKFTV